MAVRKAVRKRTVKAAVMPSPRRAWRWAEGVHVFPDAICPFCNVVMRSSCLWKVSEREQKIVAVVGIADKKLVKLAISHPHVYRNTTGSLCMGSARYGGAGSVAQAVFMGMNPADCMGMFARCTRAEGAWPNFFATYFPEHKHLERKRRARPRLFKPAPAVKRQR
jgi:hypothetical protein